jgi:hypothetical protein
MQRTVMAIGGTPKCCKISNRPTVSNAALSKAAAKAVMDPNPERQREVIAINRLIR